MIQKLVSCKRDVVSKHIHPVGRRKQIVFLPELFLYSFLRLHKMIYIKKGQAAVGHMQAFKRVCERIEVMYSYPESVKCSICPKED